MQLGVNHATSSHLRGGKFRISKNENQKGNKSFFVCHELVHIDVPLTSVHDIYRKQLELKFLVDVSKAKRERRKKEEKKKEEAHACYVALCKGV